MELDQLVAELPTCKLLTTEWDQLQDLITEHAASTSQALELMEFKFAANLQHCLFSVHIAAQDEVTLPVDIGG